MEFQFFSLASGSSGNCYYFGTPEYGILLDAGIPFRSIKKALTDYGIGLEQIMAVFVTHDHTDHIKSIGILGEQYGIPIYATEAVHYGIDLNYHIKEKVLYSRRILEKEEPVWIKDFKVTAFEVPHDSIDCVGYMLQYKDQICVLATDVGIITEKVASYIRIANHLIIEANHDVEMLESGKYHRYLKQRIRSEKGHLSNIETAQFLASNFDLHLKNIWLCHLSKDNNHPDLAYKTVEMEFANYGIRIGADVNVEALSRLHPSRMYVLC